MSKKLSRKELKDRKRASFRKPTIKADEELKMSEAKGDYDKAMADLHEAHAALVEQLKQCEAALKKCQEECHRKDEQIATLKEDIGKLLEPGDLERQIAMELPVEARRIPEPPNLDGAESKEEDASSEGTSSGTSDDEEVYVDKNLRF